jgi:cell filamentation protein
MDKIYCYPNTDVLINKFGIKNSKDLLESEGIFSGFRLAHLLSKPIVDGKFDLKHLQLIHKYIFQDIYSWGGELRTVDISKGNCFCIHQYINDEADRIFGGIKKEEYLKNLDIDSFSDRLAYYSGEINALHPFREGNGRSAREFIRCLAYNAGYTIDFSKINTEELFDAFVKSFSVDHSNLKSLFKENIIQNIKSKYRDQFTENLLMTENLMNNLHRVKLYSINGEYMSLKRIKEINNEINEENIQENAIYKVISDISCELNL